MCAFSFHSRLFLQQIFIEYETFLKEKSSIHLTRLNKNKILQKTNIHCPWSNLTWPANRPNAKLHCLILSRRSHVRGVDRLGLEHPMVHLFLDTTNDIPVEASTLQFVHGENRIACKLKVVGVVLLGCKATLHLPRSVF